MHYKIIDGDIEYSGTSDALDIPEELAQAFGGNQESDNVIKELEDEIKEQQNSYNSIFFVYKLGRHCLYQPRYSVWSHFQEKKKKNYI